MQWGRPSYSCTSRSFFRGLRMRLLWGRRLVPVLAVLALAGPVSAQNRPPAPAPPAPFIPGPWWRDFQKELGLTPDQSNRVEAVWQTSITHLRDKRHELDAAEADLS